MAMYPHTLPDLETIAGTVKITLFSEFQTLNLPAGQTIVSIGDLEETADINIGITQLSTLALNLKEDYSNYTEGFWFKVLAGECWLRFYLVEGVNTTFYFFGLPQEETIEWTEHFLGTSDYLRTCELELVSMAFKMFDVNTAEWMTEVLNNDINTSAEQDAGPGRKISVRGLFAAMLSAGTDSLNPTYSEADVSYVFNGGPDFVYNPGSGDRSLTDLSIATTMLVAPASHATTEYFDSSSQNALSKRFAKLRDLLPNLLANFGVVLKMDYDTGSARHLIKLVQRGRAYSTTTTFNGREKKSSISKATDLVADAVRATELLDESKFCWFSKKYKDGKSTDTVPNYVEFELDRQCIFVVGGPVAGLSISRSLWYEFGGIAWSLIQSVKYYKYGDSPGYETASATDAKMQEAVAGYVYHRFTNKFTFVRRTYGKLTSNNGSTDSHINATILARTNLNLDGAGDVPFYANKVRKSIERNELEIEWIKE